MKSFLQILLFILLLTQLHYPQWIQQSSNTTNDLYSVSFMDANTGWAVGRNGTILKTTNSGEIWTADSSSTVAGLKSVSIIDQNVVWVVGDTGTILKTTNGGNDWIIKSSAIENSLSAVHFFNETSGWTIGWVGWNGNIFKTTNDGLSWINQLSTDFAPLGMHFLNENLGWIVGFDFNSNLGKIMKTTNGGISWVNQPTGVTKYIRSIFFVDTQRGWAVGGNHDSRVILTTTNGGTNWIPQIDNNTSTPLFSVKFKDSNKGWVAGDYGKIIKTTNGGIDWFEENSNTSERLYDLAVIDTNNIYSVGDNGTILQYKPANINLLIPNGGENWEVGSAHNITWASTNVTNVKLEYTTNNGADWITIISSTPATAGSYSWNIPNTQSTQCKVRTSDAIDGGVNDISDNIFSISLLWEIQQSNTNRPLNAIYFTDSLYGWCVNSYNHEIFNTTNGGIDWIQRTLPPGSEGFGVYFIDRLNGWAVGNGSTYGTFWYTTTGGSGWLDKNSPISGGLRDVYFLNSTTGWACGLNGIIKSVNSGNSWFQVDGTNTWDIEFVDENNGWAVNGGIQKSTDGGLTWFPQLNNVAINKISFYNNLLGIAVGNQGKFYRTTDGGNNWILGSSPIQQNLNSCYLFNQQNAIVIGDSGSIYSSTDFGQTWIVQNSGIQYNLRDVNFVNTGQGWICGENGNVLYSAIAGELSTIELITPDGGENWTVGSSQNITWSSMNVANVKLEYTTTNGTNWIDIITSTPASTGSYNWSVPNTPSTLCRVRVSDVTNVSINDVSNSVFTINTNSLGEYLNDANTLLLYHLNETLGSTVYDYSSYNHNGTTTGTTIVEGRFNLSRSLNHQNIEYIETPLTAALKPITPFTVELWVKPEFIWYGGVGGQSPILVSSAGTTSTGGYALGIYPLTNPLPPNPNVFFFAIYTNNGYQILQSETLYDTLSWYHIAGVYNTNGTDSNIKLSVNGVIEDSLYLPNEIISYEGASPTLIFGNQSDRLDGYRQFWGLFDEIRISNNVRNPEEYNLQLPPKNLNINLVYNTINLSWENGGGSVPLMKYNIYRGFDSTNLAMIDSTILPSYSDTGLTSNTNYFYRISAVDSTGFESNKSYVISQFVPTYQVIILTPNGNEDWPIESTQIITWTSTSIANVILEYTSDNGVSWLEITSSIPASTENYNWTVPNTPSNQCRVKVSDVTNNSLFDISDTTFTISNTTFQLTVSLSEGWNMVSIPGLHPTDQNVNTWWQYRDPAANVFKFSGGYQVVTTVTPKTGYWMKHSGDRTYSTGDEWPASGILAVPHDAIIATAGWNLIGGYEYNVTVSGITTTPPGLQDSPIYGYSGGYQIVDFLIPGFGYWVKLSGDGQINLQEALVKNNEVAKWFKVDWGKIILTDAAGINYTLYAVKGEVDLDNYELPPAPPAGMFDIRFSSGRIAEDINSSMQTIDMSGVTYPLTVRVEGMDMRLMDEIGRTVNVNLKSGEDVVISDATIQKLMVTGELIPAAYALEQNYPNPFNPITTIEFSLPEEVKNVKLSIYNALGEKVAEIVNTSLVAGKYSYQWNAKNVATGMYIYELRADKFVSVKKMVLLK